MSIQCRNILPGNMKLVNKETQIDQMTELLFEWIINSYMH